MNPARRHDRAQGRRRGRRKLARARHHVLAPIEDDVIGTVAAGEVGFLLVLTVPIKSCRRAWQAAPARCRRRLRRRPPARCRQGGEAALLQQRQRDLIIRKANGEVQIDAVIERINGVCRDRHKLRIAAASLREIARAQQNFLTDMKTCDAGPTAEMRPATSLPGLTGSGGIHLYTPRRISTSGWPTPKASARICTSPGPGAGMGTSTYSRVSGPPGRAPARPSLRYRPPTGLENRLFDLIFENTTHCENYCKTLLGTACSAGN